MIKLIAESKPKARKTHWCQCCGGPILKGTYYDRSTYVYGARVYDWVSCLPCIDISSDVWDWTIFKDAGIGPEHYEAWADEHSDNPYARAYLKRAGLELPSD